MRGAFYSARKRAENLRNPTATALILISAVVRAGLAPAESEVTYLKDLRRGC